MGWKKIENYYNNGDWFIYDNGQKSKSGNYNYYYYVKFPRELCLNSKSFNKLIYTKDDAIKFRNMMIYNYLKNNDKYKDIFEKWLKE